MAVRVLLADDHPVVRAGVAMLLADADGIELVGEATDGAAAVRLARDLQPDVVLMDLRMPDVDGAAATRQIRDELATVRVLVLTTYDTDAEIVRAVEAGASGYLLKDATADELVAAVYAASRGETVLAPSVASRLVTRMRQPRGQALTDRERDVLALVAEGSSNRAIGARLFIGEATVKSHLLHIFAKLGVDGRTRAVTVAYERGILTPPGS